MSDLLANSFVSSLNKLFVIECNSGAICLAFSYLLLAFANKTCANSQVR